VLRGLLCLFLALLCFSSGSTLAGSNFGFNANSGEVVVKNVLFAFVDCLQDLLLLDDSLFSLLVGQLDCGAHPVLIVACRLNIDIVHLLLDVFPNLAILEVWE